MNCPFTDNTELDFYEQKYDLKIYNVSKIKAYIFISIYFSIFRMTNTRNNKHLPMRRIPEKEEEKKVCV